MYYPRALAAGESKRLQRSVSAEKYTHNALFIEYSAKCNIYYNFLRRLERRHLANIESTTPVAALSHPDTNVCLPSPLVGAQQIQSRSTETPKLATLPYVISF